MNRKRILFRHGKCTVFAMAALITGCATQGGPSAPGVAATSLSGTATAMADVNATYTTAQVAMPSVPVPSLRDMQELQAPAKIEGSSAEDRLRAPALRDAAMSYGARGGLAWASKQINARLQAQSSQLTRTFDFSRMLKKAPGGATILPPVISEADQTYEESDAGKTLRVADKYYLILQDARIAPTAPLWHTYLTRSYSAPEPPPDALMPKNSGERDLWRKFVAEGWDKGVEQAEEIFRQDLRRLERDFTGMVRYSELREKNQVSEPVIAESNMGVTGTGHDMRVNDRVTRITGDSQLNVQHPSQWRAPVSDMGPTEAATPPAGSAGRHPH